MKSPALSLVSTDEPADALAGYIPYMVTTFPALDEYWPVVTPLLERCVDEAMQGEMTVDDMYAAIKAGKFILMVMHDTSGEAPDVALAMVVEVTAYPQYPVLNIIALGGRQVDFFQSRFWSYLQGWAMICGITVIQASVSPAMARILSRYGFVQTYTTMRIRMSGDQI